MANINGATVDKFVANDHAAVCKTIEGLLERYYKYVENIDYWVSCYKHGKAAELASKAEELERVLGFYFRIYPDEWSYCNEDGHWHRYR